jgi:hypothetical protein
MQLKLRSPEYEGGGLWFYTRPRDSSRSTPENCLGAQGRDETNGREEHLEEDGISAQ